MTVGGMGESKDNLSGILVHILRLQVGFHGVKMKYVTTCTSYVRGWMMPRAQVQLAGSLTAVVGNFRCWNLVYVGLAPLHYTGLETERRLMTCRYL